MFLVDNVWKKIRLLDVNRCSSGRQPTLEVKQSSPTQELICSCYLVGLGHGDSHSI